MAPTIPQWRLSSLLFLLTSMMTLVSALSQSYCSSQNNGGSVVLQSIFMSNGKCYDSCLASYAFAVVQNDNCWCSNYVPSNQVSVGNCNSACPGYPDDKCGNSAQGLYGYIALNKAPLGTSGGDSTSAAATTSTSSAGRTSSSSTSYSAQESTVVSEQRTTVSPDPPTSTLSTSQSPSPSPSPSPSTTSPTSYSAVTSTQVLTIGGNSVITQTITSTSTPTSDTGTVLGTNKKSSGMAPGLIAAAVIASVLGVVLLGVLAFFFLRRRKRDSQDEKFGGLRDSTGANLNRNTSTHSKASLLNQAYPSTITTRGSSHGGLDVSDGVSPMTPSSTDRRGSRAILYDQRLNPQSLMILDNGSHTSLRTLEDHRDYGRMLKVTNPDDDPPRASMS